MSSSGDKLSAEVVLGFLEDVEPWRLLSPQFPSKVGGKPAWLSLRGLPELPELECEMCHLPMVFLLQVSVIKDTFNDPSPYLLFVFSLENWLRVDKVVIRWNTDFVISISTSTLSWMTITCVRLVRYMHQFLVTRDVSTGRFFCSAANLLSATNAMTAAAWKVTIVAMQTFPLVVSMAV